MPSASQPAGRRERNKQEKLERITAAASALFATHSINEVTTQQIADAADIGTGTLFLYAKTKGELLLLVQNTNYERALTKGVDAAERTSDAIEALMALVTPIVECNRVHTENGRIYLREMMFGDPGEPHHAEALSIVQRTQSAFEDIVLRLTTHNREQAATHAQVVSALLFVSMASAPHDAPTTEILQQIRDQLIVTTTLPR